MSIGRGVDADEINAERCVAEWEIGDEVVVRMGVDAQIGFDRLAQ